MSKKTNKAPSFGRKARIEFYRRVKSQMERGLSSVDAVSRILIAMRKQDMEKNIVYKPMQYIYKNMVSGKHGVSMSAALRPMIGDAEYTLLASAEKNGQYVQGFNEVLYMLGANGKMKGAVVSALSYPAVITVVIIGVLHFFKGNLIPVALKLAPLEKWPAISQWMYWMAQSLLPYMVIFVIFVVLSSIFLSRTMPKWDNLKARKNFDKYFPPFILYRTISGAMFLISMSSILKTGSSAQEALDFIAKGASPYMMAKVRMIQRRMGNGKRIGESLDVGLFDKETNVSIDIFSNDENFDERLNEISHESVDNTVKTIQVIGQVIFYISLVSVATVIGVMLLGFMSLTRTVTG